MSVQKVWDAIATELDNCLDVSGWSGEELENLKARVVRAALVASDTYAIVKACAESERAMFRAVDRFGESIVANYGQPYAPIPMDELWNVAGAKAMMVSSMAQAEHLIKEIDDAEEAEKT